MSTQPAAGAAASKKDGALLRPRPEISDIAPKEKVGLVFDPGRVALSKKVECRKRAESRKLFKAYGSGTNAKVQTRDDVEYIDETNMETKMHSVRR